MSKRAQKRKLNGSSKKGKLVEQIVSTLYGDSDVQVDKNVRLAAVNSNSRKREIDVLVTYLKNNQSIQTVIECKNYNKIIDVPLIDAFVGKLIDIGIPAQHGIFVSIKGFTSGAIERANKAGIKTLVLTGLSEDRLTVKTDGALQFIVFFMPTLISMTIHYEKPVPVTLPRSPFLCSALGKVRGSIYDFFWKRWIEGEPASIIGKHQIKIQLSGDYYMPSGANLERLDKVVFIEGIVQIIGLVFLVTGMSKQHLLINQVDESLERFFKEATFSKPTCIQKIFSFKTENDLQEFFDSQTVSVKLLLGRNRLPRIKAVSLYWPLSKRAFDELWRAYNLYRQGEVPEFDIEKLTYIEGSDLKGVWEPIWDENPILKEFSNK